MTQGAVVGLTLENVLRKHRTVGRRSRQRSFCCRSGPSEFEVSSDGGMVWQTLTRQWFRRWKWLESCRACGRYWVFNETQWLRVCCQATASFYIVIEASSAHTDDRLWRSNRSSEFSGLKTCVTISSGSDSNRLRPTGSASLPNTASSRRRSVERGCLVLSEERSGLQHVYPQVPMQRRQKQ